MAAAVETSSTRRGVSIDLAAANGSVSIETTARQRGVSIELVSSSPAIAIDLASAGAAIVIEQSGGARGAQGEPGPPGADVDAGTGLERVGAYLNLSSTSLSALSLANSAVQPADLANVATTGAYSDLSGKPTLGTAAAAATTDFATAAQGALAGTAVQPARTITAGTGLTGGGSLASDRTVSLDAASIASLGKADTAVQPARSVSAGTGLTGGGDFSANRTIGLDATSQSNLALGASAVQPARSISAGTGLTGGGDLSTNRTVSLSAGSISSLALADSSVQPARTITAGSGLTGGGTLAADRTVALSSASIASLAKADSAVQGARASQATAEAGSDNSDLITSLRVKQAMLNGAFFARTGTGAVSEALDVILKRGTIHPASFGATLGTGTDASAALNAALVASAATGHAVSWEGDLYCISPIVVPAGAAIIGTGWTNTILRFPTTASGAWTGGTTPLITNQNYTTTSYTDSNLTFARFKIDGAGNNVSGANHALRVAGVTNIHISEVWFKDCIDGTALVHCKYQWTDRCKFTLGAGLTANCAFDHWGGPIGVKVTECVVEIDATATLAQGIQVTGAGTVVGTDEDNGSDTVIAFNSLYGVKYSGAGSAIIINSLSDGSTNKRARVIGNYVYGSDIPYVASGKGTNYFFDGNTAEACGNTGFSAGPDATALPDFVKLVNHTCIDCATTVGAIISMKATNSEIWNPTVRGRQSFLGANPITTVSGSGTITVADTAHGQQVGDYVEITNIAATRGLTAIQLNQTFVIATVPNANSYTVVTSGSASSSGTGGGSAGVVHYERPSYSYGVKVVGRGFVGSSGNVAAGTSGTWDMSDAATTNYRLDTIQSYYQAQGTIIPARWIARGTGDPSKYVWDSLDTTSVRNAGLLQDGTLRLGGSLKVGSMSAPAYALDVTGTAGITGALTLASTLDATGNINTAAAFQIGGVSVLYGSSGYLRLANPAGAEALRLGPSGDKSNYHFADSHLLYNRAQSTLLGTIDTSGWYTGAGQSLLVQYGATSFGVITVGQSRGADGTSLISLYGATSNGGLLQISRAGGANGGSNIDHYGTGLFSFVTAGAAPILWATNNTYRMALSESSHWLNIGHGISTDTAKLTLGSGRSGSGYALLDLVGDATYTGYGLRLMRDSAGANADSFIKHRGTGKLHLQAEDAASLAFDTNGGQRMTISSAGIVNIAGLPSSATGLAAGDLWRDTSGFVKAA